MSSSARLIASSKGRGRVGSSRCDVSSVAHSWESLWSSTIAIPSPETWKWTRSTSSATSRFSRCATSRSGQCSSLITAATHAGATSLKTQGAQLLARGTDGECLPAWPRRSRIKKRGQKLSLGAVESLNELPQRVVGVRFAAQGRQDAFDGGERHASLVRRTQPHRQAHSTRGL